MTEVGFYPLLHWPLERALPKLLEKALERGHRAVVLAGSKERVDDLNAVLWTYEERSWLPHGAARDGFAEDQPIWLTTTQENPNGAGFLFLTDGADTANSGLFETVCVLFDGRDDEAVALARKQWTAFKEAGHPLTYWQQNERGGWDKKQEIAGTAGA